MECFSYWLITKDLPFMFSSSVFFFRFQSNVLNCTLNTTELSSGKRHKRGVGQIRVFFKKHTYILATEKQDSQDETLPNIVCWI